MMTQTGEKIAIFGGSFNPVHIGHLIVAEQVRSNLSVDQVWFMPTNQPPHVDKKTVIDFRHRLTMLELAVSQNPYFQIETIEFERTGKSYTYETMLALKERYPDKTFYFIIGADMVEYLPKWYRIDDLIQLVQFVAVSRPGYQTATPYPVTWIPSIDVDISSSLIRNLVKYGKSIRYLVPQGVDTLIEKEGWYKSDV